MPTNNNIRVVIFKDDDLWVAQCLEYDIDAQARDLKSLEQHLSLTLALEYEESVKVHGAPFAGIEKSPQQYFDMWEEFSRNKFSPESTDEENYRLQRALCA